MYCWCCSCSTRGSVCSRRWWWRSLSPSPAASCSRSSSRAPSSAPCWAASFHRAGRTDVAEIQQAYELLTPLLGVTGASAVFAFALLASGQNSTLTGTLAGQIVMEGFLNIRLRPWLRRLITRGIAIVPAALTAIFFGENGTARLLILSQVI